MKHVFDPLNCENCLEEAIAWCEQTHYEKGLKQYKTKYNSPEEIVFKNFVAHPNERLMFDPTFERNKKHRRREKPGWGHFKENTKIRRSLNRMYRRKLERLVMNEKYHLPRTREFRTYGWITW